MKHSMIGLTLFLLVASTWAGTLTDNFDDGNADGWRVFKGRANLAPFDETAQWFVEKGELISISKNVCMLGSLFGIGDNTWKDYQFECKFKIEKPFPPGCGTWNPLIAFGIHFDDTNPLINGYDLIIWHGGGNNWTGHGCEWFWGGNRNNPGRVGNVFIEPGKWYTAKAVVKDGLHQIFVDDQLLCNAQIKQLDAGAVVFTGKNCEVHFDNVVITGDDIPDKDLGLPVESKAKLATMWAIIKQDK